VIEAIFLRNYVMKKILLLVSMLALGLMQAFSQLQSSQTQSSQTQERGGRNQPGENVIGKVTSVSKDGLVVAPLTGGDPVTIKVGDNTRMFKDRQPIKLDEIKVDETVFARGELKNNMMQAGIVGVVNPDMMQRVQQAGGQQFNREDMGKKFIAGEVKAINETKLTIARPDGQTQDIEVDENTSFKKDNVSITLPDIKVGDFVRGRGELTNNVFIPKELIVGRPQARFAFGGPGGPAPEQKKPDAAPPSSGAPPKP
jgi:preprotein translocase subunit YajC